MFFKGFVFMRFLLQTFFLALLLSSPCQLLARLLSWLAGGVAARKGADDQRLCLRFFPSHFGMPSDFIRNGLHVLNHSSIYGFSQFMYGTIQIDRDIDEFLAEGLRRKRTSPNLALKIT